MSSSVSACEADATLGQFHKFGHLPCELRTIIWKFAARSVRRGVHILGATRDGPAGTGPWNNSATNPDGFTFVAPKVQDIPGSTQNWVDGNPSTYFQDFGLWRACPESCAIMRHQYKRLEDAIIEEEARRRVEEKDEAQKNISSTDSANDVSSSQSHFVHLGEDWPFKVFPTQDLLCLQLLDIGLPFCALSFFELPDHLYDGSLNKFENIALEYDPAWMKGPMHAQAETARGETREEMWREDNPRGVFIRILWAMARRAGIEGLTFWLIDRTIRRRQKPCNVFMPFADDDDDEKKAEPRVFHGNDGQYVEVEDLVECKYDVLKSNTAFHFLHWLQIDVGFNVSWMINRRPNRNTLPRPYGLGDLVKVLCVEPK